MAADEAIGSGFDISVLLRYTCAAVMLHIPNMYRKEPAKKEPHSYPAETRLESVSRFEKTATVPLPSRIRMTFVRSLTACFGAGVNKRLGRRERTATQRVRQESVGFSISGGRKISLTVL